MELESNNIHINNMKEMRCLINKVKNIGLCNKGIIFGGLVRDEIIALHYRHLFINKKLDYNEYWNVEYDPDTAKRTIIPNDMDIYFKDNSYVNDFINVLSKYVKIYNGYIYTNDVVSITDLNYINTPFHIIHKKIKIVLYIGKTINFTGIKLTFNIDVIYPDNSNNQMDNHEFDEYISTYEPPFNHLDFLCNIFIIERVNSKNIIRVSNNTGTIMDNMPFTFKNKLINKITNDIIEHKTEFVRHIKDNFNVEYVNIYRILKMINRPYYWDITNIPFNIFTPNFDNDTSILEKSCCICLQDFSKEDNKIVSININKPSRFLHYNCFINYMYIEQKKKYRNPDTNYIECRCPYRNPFNFKDCYLNVNYYI
jgi:hypothetical protein